MARYYPLVWYIAERLLQALPKSLAVDDLVCAGLYGLADAIRDFDPERDLQFKRYCARRIRGAIIGQLRSQDWMWRPARERAARIERAWQQLTVEYGREPTHAELAAMLQAEQR